jgi:hypothetical protein
MPFTPTTTVSPGSTRLAIAISMPAWPVPEASSVKLEAVWKR